MSRWLHLRFQSWTWPFIHPHDPNKDTFPSAGAWGDVGTGPGTGFAVNVSIEPGVCDAKYKYIFEQLPAMIIDRFQLSAVVTQCGADSLVKDILGDFNLSMQGYASCVNFVKNKNQSPSTHTRR